MKSQQQRVAFQAQWQLLDMFMLRSTGFPFSLLKLFRFQDTWVLLEQWWDVQRKVELMHKGVEEQLQVLFGLPEGPSLKSHILNTFRKLNKREFISQEAWMVSYPRLVVVLEAWNGVLEEAQQILARAKVVFEAELLEKEKSFETFLRGT